MLNRISIGWHWLEHALNNIIDEVNVNAPLGSATITADQSPNGTVLRIAGSPEQPAKQQQQQPPQSVIWHNVAWVTVTIVDPVSCAQSTLMVLAQQQGSSVEIS